MIILSNVAAAVTWGLGGPRPAATSNLEKCDWQLNLTFASRPVSECWLKPSSESERWNKAHHGNDEGFRWFEH